MKKTAAPGRKGSTVRRAFKADSDEVVDSIEVDASSGPTIDADRTASDTAAADRRDSEAKEAQEREALRLQQEKIEEERNRRLAEEEQRRAREEVDRAAREENDRKKAEREESLRQQKLLEQQRLIDEQIHRETAEREENIRRENEERQRLEDEAKQKKAAEKVALLEKRRLEQEAYIRQRQLEEEEEDRLLKEQEEKENAEEERELELLKLQMAEKERKRQEALAAIEAERLRVMRIADEDAEMNERFEREAIAARNTKEAERRQQEQLRLEAEAKAREDAELAVIARAKAEKEAKENEWKILLEQEEALQKQMEEERLAKEASRLEKLRLEAEALEALRLRQEEERREQHAREAAAERLRQEELTREAARQEKLRQEAEALRLQQEEEKREREAREAEAAAAEAARLQREQELEAKIAAAVMKEKAEADEAKRKLEEQRRKRQMFLEENDAFSTSFQSKAQENDDKLKAVKDREATLLSSEIKSSGENYIAPVPSKIIVEDPIKVTRPVLKDPVISDPVEARPVPVAKADDEPASIPAIPKPSAESNAKFNALASSLFASDPEEEKGSGSTTGAAAASSAPEEDKKKNYDLFGGGTDNLFSNRTFATKKEKKVSTVSSTAVSFDSAKGLASSSTPAVEVDDAVDWDAIEAEGREGTLTGSMQQQWKARQMDLTTKRGEFRGAVCYGLGGIFSWQMYSAAESKDLETGKPYTEYLMRCQWGTKWENMQPWLCARRYREFDTLDGNIRSEFPALKDKIIPLPGKGFLTLGVVSVAERTRGIEDYMINILQTVPQVLKSRHIEQFFDIGERIKLIKAKIKAEAAADGEVISPKLPAPGSQAPLAGAVPVVSVAAARSNDPLSNNAVRFRDDTPDDILGAAATVESLKVSELLDEARADSLREQQSSRPLTDDSLGQLEENIKELYDLARKTKPKDLQKSKNLIKLVRSCQSQWPSLRATCVIGTEAGASSRLTVLVPRAMQAEEDLDRVIKDIKSTLIAQDIGSPLHF